MMLLNQLLFAPLVAACMLLAAVARADVDIKDVTTPGGINAWLVEDHSIPFVALEMRFRGGSSLDAPGKRGAVNLMTALLEEGSGDMDSRAFARATESIAAEFGFEAADDFVRVSAKFLTETRAEATELLKTSLTDPRFDDADLERVRGQLLAMLQSDLLDPDVIAGKAFDDLLYGDHPYATSGDGTIESVTGLTRDDILAAHQSALSKDRVVVSAVGDITEAQLVELLDTLLGDLPDANTPLPGPARVNLPGGVQVVDYETPQSIALFAQPGVKRDDPDFFAAFILNHILGGGGFESRLMTEVREKRGLTYGVYSYLSDGDYAETWRGSVASANDRVAEAIEVVQAEWARLRDEGVTAQELEDAKTYLTGAYPLRFKGNGPIARIAVGMQFSDMPLDYIATRNDNINAVTLEDINRVAREMLDPDSLTFVVVGQPEGLTSSLN